MSSGGCRNICVRRWGARSREQLSRQPGPQITDVLQIRSGRPQPHVLGHVLGIGYARQQPVRRTENRGPVPLPFASERHSGEPALTGLVLVITDQNLRNRLNVATSQVAGKCRPGA
jgi:hypothetical protein